MRVLAVGNVYATYQMLGVYPFEVFTHKNGHKLIACGRLPEAVYVYATKGNCKPFARLLQALNKIVPTESLKIHRQSIIGIIWLEEISAQQAKLIAPGIPILENASQILHITKRMPWPKPYHLVSSERFDKWIKVDLNVKAHLQLHAERMLQLTPPKSFASVSPSKDPPKITQRNLSEGFISDEDEPELLGAVPPEDDEPSLVRHERSTRSYDYFAPGEVVCDQPEVMGYQGTAVSYVISTFYISVTCRRQGCALKQGDFAYTSRPNLAV